MGSLFTCTITQLNRCMKTYSYIIRSSNGVAQTKPKGDLVQVKRDVNKYMTVLNQEGLVSKEERFAVGHKAQAFIDTIIDREQEISKPPASDTPHYTTPEYKMMKRTEQLERQRKAKLEKANGTE